MVDATMPVSHAPPPASPLPALPTGGPDVAIEERSLLALVQVAVWPGRTDALAVALTDAGLPAPPPPGRSAEAGGVVAMDGGPGRWLLEGPADLPLRLAALVRGDVGTVTDLSHSRARFRLEGPRARWVLAKGTSVDLRDAAFPVGSVAWTTIHATGVVVRRAGAETFDAMPYRGFARDFAEWLAEAARPDGR